MSEVNHTPERPFRSLAAVSAAAGALALNANAAPAPNQPEISPTNRIYHTGNAVRVARGLPIHITQGGIIMPERTATAYGEAHQRESLYIRLQTPGTWDPNNYMSITERGSVSGGQISSNFEKRFLPMDLPAHRVSMIVEDDLNIWNARKRKFVTRVLSLRKYIIDPNRRT